MSKQKKKQHPHKQKPAGKVQPLVPEKKPGKRKKTLHPSVLISGYYGFDNLGDELILKVLVDELKARQVEITVLSKNPKKTALNYGVKAIKRTSFVDIVDSLTRVNLLISGGGGLFQDATGPMSTIYYGGLIQLAHFFEVPTCFWAQGLGPLKREMSQKLTAAALRKCEAITVRDEVSANLVETLIDYRPEMTADPVWLLKLPKKALKAKGTLIGKPDSKRKDAQRVAPFRIGLSLRPWGTLNDERLQSLANCLNQLAENQLTDHRSVEFVLLPLQKKEDTELLERFAKRLNSGANVTVRITDPEAVVEEIGHCDRLFGMRFHSLILGLLYNIPIYGLIYDPKVGSLIETFHLSGIHIHELETLNSADLENYFKSYPQVDLKPLKKQSRRNFEILSELLEIPEAELVL